MPKQLIRTSDRISFKRCRRKWSLSSGLRHNLESATSNKSALWFGSGIHFAMEDYYGYNRFGHPFAAFQAYSLATAEFWPIDASELTHLAEQMLANYIRWSQKNFPYKTAWVNEKPLVELNLNVPLPQVGDQKEVFYSLTIDRIVADEDGNLWIVDYKTAAKFDTGKLDTDPQITSYLWALSVLYPTLTIAGMLYIQIKKGYPAPPERLKSSKLAFSKNKSQDTTSELYRQTLLEAFGQIPEDYTEFLKAFETREKIEGDLYVRCDQVYRNDQMLKSEYRKIVAESAEMLNMQLPLYPNPTRDCSWDCDFKAVCLAIDDGSDFKNILDLNFRRRDDALSSSAWKQRIVWPPKEQTNE